MTDNTASSPETIQVSGTSAQSTVTVTPPALAFGDILVGTSQSKSVTIQDSPAFPYVIDSPTGLTPPYSAYPCCFQQNPPGSNCTVSVTFAPTAMGVGCNDLNLPANFLKTAASFFDNKLFLID